MPYSAKILIAALLLIGGTQAGIKAMALPISTMLAQASSPFPVPESVPAGTRLTIQASPNLGVATQVLKDRFESTYEGTAVQVNVTSSEDALTALQAGEIDLAAIGRPLTEAEQTQGLVTVPLERAKIAIIIGPENPFNGNLTFEQFAAMFRGEITDWSQVGGPSGAIRFVDRPDSSDTRRSLSQYEVFRRAAFVTGATADPVTEDNTATVIQALGRDGISYAIAGHVLGQPGVKIVPMHQTLPDDPRYPYSQPRYFVYKDTAGPAAAAFLGYVTSPAGIEAVATADPSEAATIAATLEAAPPTTTSPIPTSPSAPTPPATAAPEARGGLAWWWLLPLAGLGALGAAAWAASRRSETSPATPIPEPLSPGPDLGGPPQASVGVTPPAPDLAAPTPVIEAATPAVLDTASLGATASPEDVTVAESPPEPAPATTPDVALPGIGGGAMGAAGLAASAVASLAGTEDQSTIEAAKFNVIGHPVEGDIDLSTIDDGLPPLPDGYGESRIVLMPRDPQWAYTYWDTPNGHKAELRSQGGERLALRLYDVTDIDLGQQAPHSMQQFDCDELARHWYLPIPISDRDYQVEIGYLTGDGRWLVLARSNTVRIPPVYPSDWSEDHFMTINWEERLRGKTLMTLVNPRLSQAETSLHEQLYALSQPSEWERIAGSVYGSMPHVPGSMAPPISSYVFPSGVGMAALPTVSGLVPTLSGIGLNVSGLTMSGVGFSASMPPIRPRKFWLVADAELIVYGATEPDATVTVAGQPIQLSSDGTFRFQSSFPDGRIEYPIMAVAADGEQNRSIHMTFDRQTPDRRTNTREAAQEEWPNP